MKCDICHGNLAIETVECYHYKESGLDNVYLMDLQVRVCQSCGQKTPRIPKVLELHNTIARAVAMKPCPLTGREIRFLRKQLGLSAKRWAEYLRVDIATLSRWENSENSEQQPGPQSDALIRLLYFRLHDEKEGKLSCESVAGMYEQIVADCHLNLKVNMRNPALYSYEPNSVFPRRLRGTGDLVEIV